MKLKKSVNILKMGMVGSERGGGQEFKCWKLYTKNVTTWVNNPPSHVKLILIFLAHKSQNVSVERK